MMRYQIEFDLRFLLEPVTDERRELVTEKGVGGVVRFEQWFMPHVADPESLYKCLHGRGRRRKTSRISSKEIQTPGRYFLVLLSPALI